MAKSSWKKPPAKKAAKAEEVAVDPKPVEKAWEQDLNKHPKFDKFKAQGEK
jgi:hypothetical protein